MENRLLADEIQRMRERMTGCATRSNRFGEREQELRLLAASRPPTRACNGRDIGGPAGHLVGARQLKALAPGGQQALAARLDGRLRSPARQYSRASLNEAYDTLSKKTGSVSPRRRRSSTKGWLTSAFMRRAHPPDLHLARPARGVDVTAPMGRRSSARRRDRTEVRWEKRVQVTSSRWITASGW